MTALGYKQGHACHGQFEYKYPKYSATNGVNFYSSSYKRSDGKSYKKMEIKFDSSTLGAAKLKFLYKFNNFRNNNFYDPNSTTTVTLEQELEVSTLMST